MHIESLIHGNVLRDEALALAKTVEETFKPEALTVEELKSRQALIIPEGASPVNLSLKAWLLTLLAVAGKWLARRPVDNPANANSAVEQFTYVGDIYDDVLRAKLSLFGTMVSEPLFDDLRAKQQLGYIVRCFCSFRSRPVSGDADAELQR